MAERRARGQRNSGLISTEYATNGLLCCNGKVKHLGIKSAPKRSTLAYANEHRNADLYEEYFWNQLQHFRSMNMLGTSGKQFKFKNKLFLFDSTTISLCLSLFQWADYRQTKGGVKVHVLLDQSDYMPAFVTITEAKVHDSTISKTLNLKPGSIIAADRGLKCPPMSRHEFAYDPNSSFH